MTLKIFNTVFQLASSSILYVLTRKCCRVPPNVGDAASVKEREWLLLGACGALASVMQVFVGVHPATEEREMKRVKAV